jgi:outer membrane protein assembly factor BamE (lipoprotein component of BamABCDE complex)
MNVHPVRSLVLAAVPVVIAILVLGSVLFRYYQLSYNERRGQFIQLRKSARAVQVGMTKRQVVKLLGVPDAERPWLSHLPTWRVYYFDIERAQRFGQIPASHISVLIDSETGVKTVDAYDPVFETCRGNKIQGTCTPIDRKHHDRFAGPVIVGA